ncbi:MAG TPA: hypothetical protein VNX26_15050 [Candidatus Acidoferrum sp.]|jgi:hypothetical protein|nr:hypothetical protein [Candidatus Acidoferrum sp.]
MLQAHSFLWHYLWVAPNVLLLVLAVVIRLRNLHKQFPVFQIFAVIVAIEQLIVYAADVIPSVSGATFWRVFWVGLLVEALVKFALIGEIFGRVFGKYDSVAVLGKRVIRGVGIALVLAATIAAAYAPIDNPRYSVISYAHILDQTIFMIECGLLLFIFIFAAYFKLGWDNASFGIALGLGTSACVHLATWAVMANGGMMDKRYLLDFLNMATYHVCVLVWFYYFLIPQKSATTSAVPVPENSLEIWNQELERLLHQ